MTTVLPNHSALLQTVKGYQGAYLFLGHGSKGQFADINKVNQDVSGYVEQFNAQHGQGQWIAVFGGKLYNSDKPDIAHVVRNLKSEHGIPVLAIQSDVVLQQGGVDEYIDYVRYIPTEHVTNDKGEKKVHWGGLLAGKPAGPTGIYLGKDFIGGEPPILKGVVAAGGGPITLQEASYAIDNGIKLYYLPALMKHKEADYPYGPLHQWVEKSASPNIVTLKSEHHERVMPISREEIERLIGIIKEVKDDQKKVREACAILCNEGLTHPDWELAAQSALAFGYLSSDLITNEFVMAADQLIRRLLDDIAEGGDEDRDRIDEVKLNLTYIFNMMLPFVSWVGQEQAMLIIERLELLGMDRKKRDAEDMLGMLSEAYWEYLGYLDNDDSMRTRAERVIQAMETICMDHASRDDIDIGILGETISAPRGTLLDPVVAATFIRVFKARLRQTYVSSASDGVPQASVKQPTGRDEVLKYLASSHQSPDVNSLLTQLSEAKAQKNKRNITQSWLIRSLTENAKEILINTDSKSVAEVVLEGFLWLNAELDHDDSGPLMRAALSRAISTEGIAEDVRALAQDVLAKIEG